MGWRRVAVRHPCRQENTATPLHCAALTCTNAYGEVWRSTDRGGGPPHSATPTDDATVRDVRAVLDELRAAVAEVKRTLDWLVGPQPADTTKETDR